MQIKITATLKTASGTHEIKMPLTQNQFDEALTAAGIMTGSREEYEIISATSNIEPLDKSLAAAQDIEEINYLAQRLDSFDKREIGMFSAIVDAGYDTMTMRELINLTFNIWDYNIEAGIHDLDDLGRNYVENEAQDLDPNIYENIDFEAVGLNIQLDQRGEFTDIGYISNYNDNFSETYNGRFFPDYDYESDYALKLELRNKTPIDGLGETEQSVFIFLPANENTINRALIRLGAENMDECYIAGIDSAKLICGENILSECLDIDALNGLAETLAAVPNCKLDRMNAALPHQIDMDDISDLIAFVEHFTEISTQQSTEIQRPDCQVDIDNDDVIKIMSAAFSALKQAGMKEAIEEMSERVMESGSSGNAIDIIGEYVNFTHPEQTMAEPDLEEPDLDTGMNMTM
jgi:hypothetical protein